MLFLCFFFCDWARSLWCALFPYACPCRLLYTYIIHKNGSKLCGIQSNGFSCSQIKLSIYLFQYAAWISTKQVYYAEDLVVYLHNDNVQYQFIWKQKNKKLNYNLQSVIAIRTNQHLYDLQCKNMPLEFVCSLFTVGDLIVPLSSAFDQRWASPGRFINWLIDHRQRCGARIHLHTNQRQSYNGAADISFDWLQSDRSKSACLLVLQHAKAEYVDKFNPTLFI